MAKAVDIKVYGEMAEWSEAGVRYVSRYMEQAIAEGADTINLRVHSPGGSVFDGWALHNSILHVRKRGIVVNGYVDGIAASMASYILLACEKVYMASNSMMMVHSSRGMAWGTSKQLREAASILDKIDKLAKQGYVARSGKPTATIEEWMSIDTWFTPDEAVANGLADAVADPVMISKRDPKQQTITPEPKALYAAYMMIEEGIATQDNDPTLTEDATMKIVLMTLGLPEGSSEADAVKAIQTIQADKANAEQRMKAVETEVVTAKAEAAVDAAIKEGKIAAADRPAMIADAVANLDMFTRMIGKMVAPAAQAAGSAAQEKAFTSITGQLTETMAEMSANEGLVAQWDELHRTGKLAGVKASNPTLYETLRKAKFGK